MRLLCALMLLAGTGFAQVLNSPPTQTVKVSSGDLVPFSWLYDVADEAFITHFSIRWVDDLTKQSVEVKTVAKSARATALPATFTSGVNMAYYAITAVESTTSSSAPSNTVATQRIGKPPRNFSSP